MTTINITRSDEKATAILRAIRQIDGGAELTPIVRCQDCKHWDTNHCPPRAGLVFPNTWLQIRHMVLCRRRTFGYLTGGIFLLCKSLT